MSFGFFCCIVFWFIVIGVPIAVSYWVGRSRVRNDFKLHVRSLQGLVIRENDKSIEVQLPCEAGTVAAAFFPLTDHWFGRRVLELHFTLPSTDVQCFVCGNHRLSRNVPTGWTIYQDGKSTQPAHVLAATATPTTSEKYFRSGLVQAYAQLEKIHPQTSRLTIDNDQLILLVSEFASSASEISNLLVFGSQLVRQLESVNSGDILVVSPTVVPAGDAQCPICFSTVVQPIACDRCGTPHCRDCWSYNEMVCGVFGCGGHPIKR
ncbi:MAG: hypothetical protein JNK57_22005 [Planctomycetaceae bacterium]|nr:hypothetical protein [Planctomycetaceae bacterium]